MLRKSLYPLAIALAAEEQCALSEIMRLYQQYGDHLFKKGDFDAAVQQYCITIGHIPPSYVIKYVLHTPVSRQSLYRKEISRCEFKSIFDLLFGEVA